MCDKFLSFPIIVKSFLIKEGFMNSSEVKIADFLEKERDEVRFEKGEFVFPDETSGQIVEYDSYSEETSSYIDRNMAHIYASAVAGSFKVAEGALKTVYKGLSFLAKK